MNVTTREPLISDDRVEARHFPPSPAIAEQANAQPGIYEEADRDPEAFWAGWAQ